MNLHGIVRSAINTVNPDILGTWREQNGTYTTGAGGVRVPNYTDHVNVPMQVQAASGKDLQHPNMLNVQGVVRSVYLFGNVQGTVRPDAKGGDLLRFPQSRSGPLRTWLVVAVLETWTPDTVGWCKVGVALQVDA